MKLVIKTLKQVSYNVELTSEKPSVVDLKNELVKSHGFELSSLKLLFNGCVLDDSKNLEDYKIQDGSIIIMMISKVKPKNVQPPQNIGSSQQKPEEKKPEEKKPEEKKPEEKKPSEPKPVQKPPEQNYTQQLNSLIDMGFERSQAEAAIKAARGHVDLAVEFLYNGIPEGIENLNNAEMEEGQDEGEEGDDINEGEDPIKIVASIAKIICINNPAALSDLMENIQQTNPELMNSLKEREEEFKHLLEQPVNQEDYRNFQRFGQQLGLGGEEEGHEEHEHEHRQINLNLTPEDQEVIKRLKDLGNFSEADVIQAYIACEKNEELTANYLFEQKMRDDDEMFGGNNNNNNNNNGNGQ